ncbi:MAG: hypothetical protein R6V06_01245 [Kiritimatiellia bacterium]
MKKCYINNAVLFAPGVMSLLTAVLLPLCAVRADLVLRLDASRLPPGLLSSWEDTSGNANDAVQNSDSTRRPNVVNLGSVFNGRNVVEFGGVDDSLTNKVNYTARTVVAVFRVDSALRNSGNLGQIWGQYSGVGHVATDFRHEEAQYDYWSFDGNTNAEAVFARDGADFTSTPAEDSSEQPWSDDTVHMVTVQYTSDLAVDEHSVGGFGGAWNHYFGGQIAEVLVFDTTLTSDERAGLEYLMAEYWGVSGPSAATQTQIDAANALFPGGVYVDNKLVFRLQAKGLPLGTLTSWEDTSSNTNDVAQSEGSR